MSSTKAALNCDVPSVVLKSFNTYDLKTNEAVLAQQNHLYVDLCFVCADSQKIKLHKLVVGRVGGILAELLENCARDVSETTVIFPDVDGEDLITVVSAIYTGFCWVSEDKVADLRKIVNMLKLPLLFEIPQNEHSNTNSVFEVSSNTKSETKTVGGADLPLYEIDYVQIEELDPTIKKSRHKPLCSILKRNLPCLETTVIYKRSKESNTFNRAKSDNLQPVEPRKEIISSTSGSGGSESSKTKVFECVQCDFKSCLSEEIIIHKKMAHRTFKHKCSLCTKTFTRKNDLTRHLMLHSGERKYACTFCDAKFIGSGDLHKHVRIHTGERPHRCNFDNCNKSFTQKGDLNKHVKIHLKIKNHKCHLCGYSCIQGSDLNNHLLTHSNSKPFPCDLCFKSFRRNNQLNIHMKRYHPTYNSP